MNISKEVGEDLALYVAFIQLDDKRITVAPRVVQKGMTETTVLAFTIAAGLLEIAHHKHVAKNPAGMTAEGSINVYPSRPVYITFLNFCMIDVYFAKHRNVGDVTNAPVEIPNINYERNKYPTGAQPNDSNISASAIYALQAYPQSTGTDGGIWSCREEGRGNPHYKLKQKRAETC